MEIIEKYFSDFSPTQLKQLAALKELYGSWNEKINVISRKDIDNFLSSSCIALTLYSYPIPI